MCILIFLIYELTMFNKMKVLLDKNKIKCKIELRNS